MEELPSGMEAELAAWNDGRGIDLPTWLYCTGDIRLAIGYTTIFWPRFVEFENYILKTGFDVENLRVWEAQLKRDRQAVESLLNHVHIADLHENGDEHLTRDRVVFLAETLKEIYTVKLRWQFPDRSFEVSFFHPEDPEDLVGYQITFWQK